MATASAAAGGGGYHAAKIVARRVLSPTVVALDLEVLVDDDEARNTRRPPFSFQPGQWLDLAVPPHTWVGGFSPATLPSDLPRVTIAVKRSSHPPSQWVHSDASRAMGRRVQVQVGGTCVLDTSSESLKSRPVVFCAGGIGVSPLLSMYPQWASLVQQQQQQALAQHSVAENEQSHPPRASFLYSVSTEEELVFEQELLQVATLSSSQASTHCEHNLVFTVTQQRAWTESKKRQLESLGAVQCRTGRFLRNFLEAADPASVFYLCGPAAMLDEGVALLQQERGIDTSNINFERWW